MQPLRDSFEAIDRAWEEYLSVVESEVGTLYLSMSFFLVFKRFRVLDLTRLG